jgi:hypothetical protein
MDSIKIKQSNNNILDLCLYIGEINIQKQLLLPVN